MLGQTAGNETQVLDADRLGFQSLLQSLSALTRGSVYCREGVETAAHERVVLAD